MRLRPALACALLTPVLLALPATADGCSIARSVRGTNPTYAQVSAAIDDAATRRKVPPVLLKAIAWRESGWQQFTSDGRAKLSSACAVGVMQVLPAGWDARRLAADYRYNVDAGTAMLAAKMSASGANVPSGLGPDERRVLENWYRATYRYLGSGYQAERYADQVFGLVTSPPSGVRPWAPPVPVTNPKTVFRGYHPTGPHGYVARLDGTWVSTLGRARAPVNRADLLAYGARMTAGRALETDQRAAASVTARNIGWATWSTSRVTLGTWPVGRSSRLRDGGWLTATRPAGLRAETRPGQSGRFDFPVRAGLVGSQVTTQEVFVPLVDGQVPIVSGRAGSTWTLHPPQAPVAAITAAPRYLTDATVDYLAPIRLSFSDPAPGAGVYYVEVASRCATCEWAVRARGTTTSVRIALSGSGRHDVRVRAVDRAGHWGAWTEPVSVVVPRDDTTLAFTGEWTAEPVSGAWLGSLATAAPGAAVETSFTGSAYAVIGSRGPALASLAVYLDGVLVTVVSPVAEATVQRQVLHEGTVEPGEHVVRVVVDGVATRGYVDAIAVT